MSSGSPPACRTRRSLQRTPETWPLPNSGLTLVSFGFGCLAVDGGLLPPGASCQAIRLRVQASDSLAFTLCGRPLAFVREQLSLICQLIATIRDEVPLISDAVPPVSR